jgi:hypothetical protein
MEPKHVKALLLQTLEHERGSVDIYQTALKCALNADLKAEWARCLAQTRSRELILTQLCRELSMNPEQMTPGREIKKYLGESLTSAMELAHESASPQEAQLIACECVTLSETITHSNWQRIEHCARDSLVEEQKQPLSTAVGQIKDAVDQQYYRARGWEHELWLESLGAEAVLPPPEEREAVIDPIRAGQVEHGRELTGGRAS